MRHDRNLAYFAPHYDWYTAEKGVGYVPTEKAPKESAEAETRCNSCGIKPHHPDPNKQQP